jgi:hypothetical protein
MNNLWNMKRHLIDVLSHDHWPIRVYRIMLCISSRHFLVKMTLTDTSEVLMYGKLLRTLIVDESYMQT